MGKREAKMTDVEELVALYLSMDDEARDFTLATARRRAKRCPAQRPALILVADNLGGGALGSELGGLENLDLPPVS